MPEPAQHADDRLADVREQDVVEAGDEQRDPHGSGAPGGRGPRLEASQLRATRGRPRAGPRATPRSSRGRGPGRARCRSPSPRPARRPPGRPLASAVSWHRSSLRLPPPTTWIVADVAGRRGRPAFATAAANAAARLSRMQRTTAAGSTGGGSPARSTSAAIRAGMSPGGSSEASLGSMTGPPAGQRAGRGEQRGQRPAATPGALPGPDRLLEQPQAHHVAQEADPSVDAHLVREVGEPARRRSRIGASSSRPTRPQVPHAM